MKDGVVCNVLKTFYTKMHSQVLIQLLNDSRSGYSTELQILFTYLVVGIRVICLEVVGPVGHWELGRSNMRPNNSPFLKFRN